MPSRLMVKAGNLFFKVLVKNLVVCIAGQVWEPTTSINASHNIAATVQRVAFRSAGSMIHLETSSVQRHFHLFTLNK